MNEQTNGQTTDSYRNVNRYLGQDYRYAPTYIRPRPPTTGDIKPKEQQGHYPVTSFWSYPAQQKLWALVNITNNLANWVLISSGSSGPLLTITGDDSIAVSPVAGNINLRGIVSGNALFAKPVFTENIGAGNELISVQVGAAIASTNVNRTGLLALNSTQFTVDGNGFASLIGGTGPALQGLSDDVNTFVSPAGSPEKIQLVGHVVEQGATKFSTVVAGTNLLNINPMSSARWIVDALGFNGTHTTISSAIASATSGDTILVLPGTYTENPALKTGVNITAFLGDSITPNVIINGKCTYSSAGATSISNVTLQTNSDFCLEVTGSSASTVLINNCFINTLNHTSINYTTASVGSALRFDHCTESASTTGITFLTATSTGNILLYYTFISGGGDFTSATTTSATFFNFQHSFFNYPITISSTGGITAGFTTFGAAAIALTINGSRNASLSQCTIGSGTFSAMSIGATATVANCTINSSNTNVFTGAGTINTGGNVCTQSSGNNVSTINHLTVI